MAHQHLDSTQIVPGFQKVGGKAVTKRMDAGALLNFSLFSSFFVDLVYRCVSEWVVLFFLKGRREQVRLWLTGFVITAQLFKQLYRKDRLALFSTFSIFNFDQHPFAVDVFRF
jgi:hypothetical protein